MALGTRAMGDGMYSPWPFAERSVYVGREGFRPGLRRGYAPSGHIRGARVCAGCGQGRVAIDGTGRHPRVPGDGRAQQCA